MRKGLVLGLAMVLSVSSFAADKKVEVDAAGSKIVYVGKKVTGEHTGSVKIQSGTLTFAKDALTGGTIVADMTSITVTDITDNEYIKKFLEHMASDDFFSTAKNKTATLVVKSAKKVSGNKYSVTADLTIKGKTAPVTFDADVSADKAVAKVLVDRTKYDIKYGSGKFFQNLGDKMINDEFSLDVTLALKK